MQLFRRKSFLGQTRTRSVAPPEQMAAMNAPSSQLPGMCAQGNKYACDLAKIPLLTEAESLAMAQRRDQQAAADRAALARRLDNVGQGQVAQAVRDQKDVQYVSAAPTYNFTDIAAGISSILTPLASGVTGILQTQQQAQLIKAPLKTQSQIQMPAYTPIYKPPADETMLIVGVAAGGAVLLILILAISLR